MPELRSKFMGAEPSEFAASRVSFGANGEQTGITAISGMGGHELAATVDAGMQADFLPKPEVM